MNTSQTTITTSKERLGSLMAPWTLRSAKNLGRS